MCSHIGSSIAAAALTVFLAVAPMARSAELAPATLAAWNDYLATAQACADQRLGADKTFLWIDDAPERAERLRQGEILVSPASAHTPLRVASGLIHDWMVAAFIPDTGIDRVISSLRQYDSYSQVYRPAVVRSQELAGNGDEDRFSLLLVSRGFAKIAVDAEFVSSIWHNGNRACRIARATHLREIDDYGQRGEKTLPDDQGAGYIWRFHSISRMEERDGGVYLETEVIALSRDVPASIEWLIAPMIRRVAKGALSAMLEDTRKAVINSPANPPERAAAAAAVPHSSLKADVK